VLAAASAVDREGGMPAELELALQCQQWGVLPEAGGLMDQPLGLLNRMGAALNAYSAFKSEKNRGNVSLSEWSRRSPDAWRVVARIERMRMDENGE